MAPKYKAPRGTQDVLPQDSWRWQRLEAAFREVCRRYAYREIRTPVFEETELFARGVGEGTELVHKQMYTFQDRGGRSLTLRAEGTAPVVRAYLEHNLGAAGGTQKLYYICPIFRYERPQAGRYRQHHQLGVEAIGSPGPEIDAEVIALYHDFLDEVGLEGAVTHLSSIGCPQCRPALSQALRDFFAPHVSEGRGMRPTRSASWTARCPMTWNCVRARPARWTTCVTRAESTSRGCARGSTRSASSTRWTPPSCAGWTITPAPRSR